MKINTKYFGEYQAADDSVFEFPDGLFGFEGPKSFALIPFDAQNEASFLCLQSIDDSELAFVVFNPFYIDSAYSPGPLKEDLAELEVEEKTPVSFLVITILRDDFTDSTVNMKCPVMLNNQTKKARQIILPQDYSMRRRLTPKEKAG